VFANILLRAIPEIKRLDRKSLFQQSDQRSTDKPTRSRNQNRHQLLGGTAKSGDLLQPWR
jgi:hypothetical protein